jgi:hypothetical protein
MFLLLEQFQKLYLQLKKEPGADLSEFDFDRQRAIV